MDSLFQKIVDDAPTIGLFFLFAYLYIKMEISNMGKKIENLNNELNKAQGERVKCRDNCDLKANSFSQEISMLRNEMHNGFKDLAVAIAKLQAQVEKK